MRRVSRACLLAVLAAGCLKASAPAKIHEPPEAQAVEASSALNGTPLTETRDGPWVVRGSGTAAAGAADKKGMAGAAPAEPSARLASDDSAAAPKEIAIPTMAVPAAPSARMELKASGAAPKALAKPTAVAPPPAGSSRSRLSEAEHLESDSAIRPAATTPLRASATDDNLEFSEFVRFLASWSDRPDTAGKANLLDVRDRRFVKVVDGQGHPIPAAQIRVIDEAKDKAIWAASTYGDGRAPFYPRLSTPSTAPAKYLVESSFNGQRSRATWDGSSDLSLTLNTGKPVATPIQLDVLFALDTTGSMQDEIDRIKASLLTVTDKLKTLKQEFDLRYGAVLYRDLGDEYVTRNYPFTSDIRAFSDALQAVNAGGGGDEPESVNQALAEAVRAQWRPNAAKVLFLIGDAPPHMDYQGDVPYGQSLKAAAAKGVRIHSIAASGLNPLGTLVWRQVAQFTRGKFIFIEYGSAAASAESHGVTGGYKSNNLDDILFEQIRDELAQWGRDAPAPSIARP